MWVIQFHTAILIVAFMKRLTSNTRFVSLLSLTLAGIMVLVPFHAVFTTWLGSNFGHMDLFRIWKELLLVPVTLACIWLVYGNEKQRKHWNKNKLVVLILAYTLLNIVAGCIAFAQDKVTDKALIFALLINVRFLVFFLACVVVVAYSDWLKTHWRRLLLVPAYMVIGFGLLQVFVLPKDFLTHFGYGPGTIPAIHTVDQKLEYMRVQSFLRGPNPLGAYLVIVLTALTGFWYARRREAWWAVWTALAGLVLLLTYSRSAWAGAFLSLAVFLWLSLRSQRYRQYLAIGGVFAVIIASGVIFALRNNDVVQNTVFHTDENSVSATSSNEVRSSALTSGIKDIAKHPLGQGPGTAGPASFRNKNPKIAENYFLQIGQELGVIGLGLFLAINVWVARFLYSQRREFLPRLALATLAGLTLINMFSHAWADDTLAYIWWGLAGIALSGAILKQKRKAKNV